MDSWSALRCQEIEAVYLWRVGEEAAEVLAPHHSMLPPLPLRTTTAPPPPRHCLVPRGAGGEDIKPALLLFVNSVAAVALADRSTFHSASM